MIRSEHIPDNPKDVRRFGLLFSVVGVVVAGITYARESDLWPVFLLLSVFFLLTALVAVPVLRPIYVVWMKFAFILGWINTRIILGIAFFLVLTPVAIMMRLFGKTPIDLHFERERESYWVKRNTPYDPRHSERKF